jgi:protein-S-isoprenylcysteine O-methyltransferase Ste14
MDEPVFYDWLVIAWLALAAITFIALFFITAPYGRFTRGGWGPRISARWGWVLMESPSLITFLVFYLLGDQRGNPLAIVFLAMWAFHYINRSFVYPFRVRSARPSITISVIAMGAVFNMGNGYLNSRYLYTLGPDLELSWMLDPRFIIGVILFVCGFALNQQSDRILISLRRSGETGYKIPYGGGYRFVSCPNYLGEIIEWGGWALAVWNPGGLAFFVWTAANLAPRAIKTHGWYKREFPDYPPKRKALIPFIV